MTYKITLKIEPLDYCFINEYDPSASLSCIVNISFETEEDGFSWGANQESLLNILSAIEDFFEGKITEDTEIRLLAPWHMGKLIIYQSSFFIDSRAGNWTYRFKRDEESESFDYTYKLSDEQLNSVYEQLKDQYRAIDWSRNGKIDSYTFSFPKRDFEWCYSASELKSKLVSLADGERIKAIFVSAADYVDPLRVKYGFVNYFSGEVLIQLENYFIDLGIWASGLIAYRFFDSLEASVKGPTLDFIRDRYGRVRGTQRQVCDVLDAYHSFKLEYKDCEIKKVSVDATSWRPWTPTNFDRSRIGDTSDLPECIRFVLTNGNTLSFIGCDDDFMIKIAPTEDLE